ncbi:uncharacterized protein LOC130998274 [Salvia miltiorrhiza]|uniref:uncharacterized protein LOC130998274 n=1 Tax=Salvia miltiorrhiza TaxID=226208 RepID=UPI0025AD186C|nr:uncharacterized protein LOC130998274 [Salvia miltiorrhiza]
MVNIGQGGSLSGEIQNRWFWNNIKRKIGNGRTTKFWEHGWTGTRPLKLEFPRLFQLTENKEATISEFGKWENGGWIWELKWRRDLFQREIEASNELLSSISSVSLVAGNEDGWCWRATKNETFSTKSAYELIKATRNQDLTAHPNKDLIAKVWDTPAPQKARVTAWRALRNRLPTCNNLVKRNIQLGVEEVMCNAYFHQVESANHCFLTCPKAEVIWNSIYQWLGITDVRQQCVVAHLESFAHLGRSKRSRKFLTTLWMCTIWLMWKWRNVSRFDSNTGDTKSMIGELKVRMWSWIKTFGLLDYDISFSSWFTGEIHNFIV